MKNRFKFRVWDKENFNYLEFEGFKKGEIEFNFDIDTNSIWIEFDHNKYILEQCTGLKDKNGKLIYEGDIINIWCKNFTKNQISEVKFCKERAAFTFDYFTDFGNIVPCTMDKTEIEVIGNIYENKELLNEI